MVINRSSRLPKVHGAAVVISRGLGKSRRHMRMIPAPICGWIALWFLTGQAVFGAPTSKASSPPADGFEPIFDGKSLAGWMGRPELWRVEDGSIVGSTAKTEISNNTFLIYQNAEVGDFS